MRFVLVHGGLKAGWQWELVVPELDALGHIAIAPDLPGHGSQRDERACLRGYQLAVAEHSPFLSRPADLARLLVTIAGGSTCPTTS